MVLLESLGKEKGSQSAILRMQGSLPNGLLAG